jgi:hypothetical protein
MILFLLAAGAGAWLFVVRPLLPRSEAAWEAQIEQHAIELIQLIRHEPWIEDESEYAAAWEKRRALYDASHAEELRRRLLVYIDWDMAEYAEAKDIYVSGRAPGRPSRALLDAQARFRDAYGKFAEEMIEKSRRTLLEKAYLASPRVAQGNDPDLPAYDQFYDELRSNWLPRARDRVERLTAPVE